MVAKSIGADFVISGEVSTLGSIFIFTLKLHSTENNNLLAAKHDETNEEKERASSCCSSGNLSKNEHKTVCSYFLPRIARSAFMAFQSSATVAVFGSPVVQNIPFE